VTVKFDVRNFSEERREELAWRIHEAQSWQLPKLTHWNYSLCREHARGWDEEVRTDSGEVITRKVFDRPKPMCRKCAIHFRKHQQISIAWLYFKKYALLADTMGSGKTTSAGGLVAMLLETGELSLMRDRSNRFGGMGRAVIVPRSPALHQWRAELQRMMPGLNILLAEGTRKDRRQRYLQPWQVLLIGPEMLREDIEMIERFDLSLLLTDDVDALRNPDTATSLTLDRLGSRGTYGQRPGTDRYVIMTGTPLQKRLPELHAIFDGIGGMKKLGTIDTFMRRHVRTGLTEEFDPKEGRMKRKTVITGYKNLDIVKQQIAPLYLRRTADDLDDVTLPTIMPNDVFLDLYPAQRAKYAELKKGVLKIIREEGAQVKRPTALAQIHYGAAICAGLAALGEKDGPGTSVKMDWVMEQMLEGDLVGEKIVVFANLKNTVRALQDRFRENKVGFVTVWGEEKSKAARAQAQERFWEDKSCRVLIGTKAIEQSLNLQVSRHLVNIDTILNPARMEQLAGRVRRDGSAYQHVYVHNLLTVKTQEEGYLPLLEREAALASHIWDENSQLFNALPPLALLQLIGQSG
jgi:SNF2 family DNA or RNA helicase